MKKIHYFIGILIIVVDQLVKLLFTNKNFTIIPKILNITYTQNIAGAFGMGKRYIILILSIIIIIGLIIYLIKENEKITNYIPFVLILSGSIANLIDRIFRGYVIDFIDIRLFNFPNFNIADISIVLGIILLIIIIFRKK